MANRARSHQSEPCGWSGAASPATDSQVALEQLIGVWFRPLLMLIPHKLTGFTERVRATAREPSLWADICTRATRRFKKDGLLRGGGYFLSKFVRKLIRYDGIYFFGRFQDGPFSPKAACKLAGLVIRKASCKEILRFEYFCLGDNRSQYRRKAYE